MNWQRARVTADGTHHVIAGEPAYPVRFDAVGKYHAPGLAPVRLGDRAWHIDVEGRPAYDARFRQTFGFYDERAAVDDGDAWFHIDTRGRTLAGRYAWCGNFQCGRAPVRDVQGSYFHVDRDGRPIYSERWRYAGDYRDDVAVVQAADGRHTHIDATGRLLHGRWFLDLDVFHKGHARARDYNGWVHVNLSGEPIYARRFAAVEPFYNGQARVELADGALEVIDESARTMVRLREPRDDTFMQLSSDLVGYWRTETIASAVELGVFEQLPGKLERVVSACSLSEDRALRLLRALAELRLVELHAGSWRPTTRGELLSRDHSHSLADAALEFAALAAAWRGLVPALQVRPSWKPARVFEQLALAPERRRQTHAMLSSYATHDYTEVPRLLGLHGRERVIDAGGGTGALASALLAAHPNLEVLLLERPEVLSLRDPSLSVTPVAGDLFEDWDVDADLVILARVLHDWDDEPAQQILRRARAALRPGGCLAIIDMVLGDPEPGGGLCDLHLLVVNGGRERTEEQWKVLLRASGLMLEDVLPLASVPPRLLLARPIDG